MKAIILAGGKGTRFLPLTENLPKALIPLHNKTLLELAIDQLPAIVDEVIVTTKHYGDQIKEKIGVTYDQRKILYSLQPPDTNGTWPAFYAAKEHIKDGEMFCVLGCDDFYKTRELERIIKNEKVGFGVTKTVMPAKYHGVRMSDNHEIIGLERHSHQDREELVTDYFANGFFLLDWKVFSFEPVKLIDGEYGLPQTVLAQKEHYPLRAYLLDYWQPCNTFDDLKKI